MKRIALIAVLLIVFAAIVAPFCSAQETSTTVTMWSWNEEAKGYVSEEVYVDDGRWEYSPTYRHFVNIRKYNNSNELLKSGYTFGLPAELLGVATRSYVDRGHLPISLLSIIPFPANAADQAKEIPPSFELKLHTQSAFFNWNGKIYLAIRTAYYLGWEVMDGQGHSWIVPEWNQIINNFSSTIYLEGDWQEKWIMIDNYPYD